MQRVNKMHIIHNDKLYKNVAEIMRKRDPLKLIEEGAPEDEYNLQVPEIIKYLENSLDEDFLAEFIYQLYKSLFPPDFDIGDKDLYRKIAHEIKITI